MKDRLAKYFERVGIALSILLNVILGGPSNQTFSARNHLWKKSGKPNLVWLIDFLIFWDIEHCLNSWLYWKVGKDLRNIHIKTKKKGLQSNPDEVYYYHQE